MVKDPSFGEHRRDMIDRYVRQGYLDEGSKLAEAMGKVPREAFMPGKHLKDSYRDDAFSIPPFSSNNQTISAPYTYALFYSSLSLEEGDSFLEVGTGSGYGAALAKELVGEEGKVVTVEINPVTYRFGKKNLEEAGYSEVVVKEEDGSVGCPEEGLFNKICLTAAASKFPSPLKKQLTTPGKIIGPIGSSSKTLSFLRGGQSLVLLERSKEGGETRRSVENVVYVPLKGKHGQG